MIQDVTMYRLVCDGCGEGDDGEYYAWKTVDGAFANAEGSGCYDLHRETESALCDDCKSNGKILCPYCGGVGAIHEAHHCEVVRARRRREAERMAL